MSSPLPASQANNLGGVCLRVPATVACTRSLDKYSLDGKMNPSFMIGIMLKLYFKTGVKFGILCLMNLGNLEKVSFCLVSSLRVTG